MSYKVLVTGGAGYIGSMVCKTLAKHGHTPIVFDNLSLGHKKFVKWGPLHIGDLRYIEDLHAVFEKFEPECVIHLGASAYVVESIQNPSKYYSNNVLSAIHLLEAMKKYHVSHLVFSSSCATYGIPQQIPIAETHPQQPISPYGKTKLMVEEMLKDFAFAYDSKFVILRYFNAAGSDFDLEIGELHNPETHLIPLTVLAALKQKSLTIYGDDFPTHDGTAIRDYVHVQDLANAHVLALEYTMQNNQSLTLNLGTGQGSSIKQIIKECERITSASVPHQVVSRREGEPAQLIADSTTAKKILGWEAKHSHLHTIIDTAFKWHKKHIPF